MVHSSSFGNRFGTVGLGHYAVFRNYRDDFHTFVMVPADKASNNIIIDELGLFSGTINKTYTLLAPALGVVTEWSKVLIPVP